MQEYLYFTKWAPELKMQPFWILKRHFWTSNVFFWATFSISIIVAAADCGQSRAKSMICLQNGRSDRNGHASIPSEITEKVAYKNCKTDCTVSVGFCCRKWSVYTKILHETPINMDFGLREQASVRLTVCLSVFFQHTNYYKKMCLCLSCVYVIVCVTDMYLSNITGNTFSCLCAIWGDLPAVWQQSLRAESEPPNLPVCGQPRQLRFQSLVVFFFCSYLEAKISAVQGVIYRTISS